MTVQLRFLFPPFKRDPTDGWQAASTCIRYSAHGLLYLQKKYKKSQAAHPYAIQFASITIPYADSLQPACICVAAELPYRVPSIEHDLLGNHLDRPVLVAYLCACGTAASGVALRNAVSFAQIVCSSPPIVQFSDTRIACNVPNGVLVSPRL
ncbi:hypothetical protein BDZ89DRAFT_386946 [Hymenopellis radicata]|nr:hypothetical protein BDZ89DRAFT_386946 [Hymenopellis radicata]